MVRIHPGQLYPATGRLGRLGRLLAVACACAIPSGVSAASPASRVAPTAERSVVLQQVEPRATPDSVDQRNQAEDAQGRFERIRRRLMPYVLGGGSGSCDERIGRLCFWHGGEDDWEPGPEPAELVEAREDMLATMAAAADHIPADGWILGQRIRYLSEAGRWEEAVGLARSCGGAPASWCSLLEGFGLHGMGLYEEALERFHSGLAAMDSIEALEWRDPAVLLDGTGSSVLEDAPGESAWEEMRGAVWTLADPLYLVPGNDRESEHYARWTFSKMSDDARNAWGMRWGEDLEEITVRYGWDRGWEQVRRTVGAAGGLPSVIGHQLPGGKEFIPPGRVLEGPFSTAPGAWIPEERSPRSTHVAAYAPLLLPGVAQVAVFHRGDSIVVAASTVLPEHPDSSGVGFTSSPLVGPESTSVTGSERRSWPQPALLDGPARAGLFLVDGEGRITSTEVVLRGSAPGTDGLGDGARGGDALGARDPGAGALGGGTLHLVVPAGGYLLSVEAWAPEQGLAGRIRHGISSDALPADLATLSDLVLLRATTPLPQTLTAALPSIRPSTRVESGSPLVLGWEVFGLGWREEEVSYQLSLRKEGQGFFGTIGRWFGFGGPDEPLRMSWAEPGPTQAGPWFRSVEITIPEVDPGEYVFHLEVRAGGRGELVQTLLVEVLP